MSDYFNNGIFNIFKAAGGAMPQVPEPPLVRALNKGNKSNNKPRPRGMPDLRGSVTPGSMEPAASNLGEGIQMQKAERHRAGAGYPDGVTRPDYYPVESNRTGGDVTTTNENGVTQTMKPMSSSSAPIDMSRSFDDLLRGVGVEPFSSNQLNNTMSNPYNQTTQITPGFGEDIPDIGGYNGATYDSEGGRTAASSRDLSQFSPMTGNETRIPGGSERIAQQATGISSSRLSDALNGVMEQEANRPMTDERRRAAASMAFYNADNVMDGLKARDAVNNVVYAGGQHWGRGALTEDGKLGDKYKIDRADARDIASGKTTNDELLKSYKTRIIEAQKSTPASSQDPVTTFSDPTDLQISKPGASGFELSGADFKANNDEGDTEFPTSTVYTSGMSKNFPTTFGGF